MAPARRQDLTYRANVGVGRHGWLRLTPAYGVRLVRERLAGLPAGSVVTDPFSGTGTTPLAAAELGHRGQSIDLNPFLIWLGRTKTRDYSPAQLTATQSACAAVIAAARAATDQAPWLPALHRIEKWWSPQALRALGLLRAAIEARSAAAGAGGAPHHARAEAAEFEKAVEPAEIALLRLGLCRTLITCSNAAFNHQSMSFRDAQQWEFDAVLELFTTELETLISSAAEPLPGSAIIRAGDSREVPSDLEPADLVLTSPPYVNRMSYIRELRPYMYWLGYLDAPSDAGALDWEAIGGTWGVATSRLTSWQAQGSTPVEAELDQVCARIAADGGRSGPVLATYVRKYHHDMWAHFTGLERVLRPQGRVCYIIGNSTFYDHEVPAQRWFAAMLQALDYQDVQCCVIRKRNSNKALFEYAVTAQARKS
ncbi:site-specific DNA-methyltransferase [Gephyromycinifex aptenodytis]|uniref:site-specific DNA-methyltransferase n=1 Tax=Gephyromycinifex aptenodytis TaxID=2716227 RepID=UPI00144512FC|nr:site-specific DNA-methyltransferase [Gephyromycinifex aptenodytis]